MTIEAAFTGRLGQPPARRTTKSGKAFVTLSVAVAGEGERDDGEAVQWVGVSCFGDLAAAVADLAKGDRVYVEGRLRLSTWTDKEGRERNNLQVTATLARPFGRLGRRRPSAPVDGSGSGGPDEEEF